jgi:hypothetical protein
MLARRTLSGNGEGGQAGKAFGGHFLNGEDGFLISREIVVLTKPGRENRMFFAGRMNHSGRN